ncbi:MAG: hypothetical protein EHM55_07175 [Acidobacteria bacterium]|nr:MAG: hypothetical protein EHM55_07175 [Acidobacteriota bacterium]
MIRQLSIARWVSVVFHPFVMVGVMVGTVAAARQAAGDAARTVAVVVALTVVPLGILMVRQVRRGAWDTVDASNRAERPILYLVGGAALVALLLYVVMLRPQPFMVRGVTATLGMVAACALATRWIKVSLHMAFATFAASTLVWMRSPAGYLLLLALPALVWSRLALRRHTSGEVALGAIIGAGAGAAVQYL